MVDTRIVSSAVSRRITLELLIRLCCERRREQIVKLATVDEEGRLALLEVCLPVPRSS